MSLHVVARLHGLPTATWTARRMEYDWTPADDVRGKPWTPASERS
jgi:hypothetical protein